MTNLLELGIPFEENEIEWRIGQTGKSNGNVWANALAYVSARAIMDRLDKVVGPGNWKVRYYFPITDAMICELSIKCGEEWITKEDGAEQTDIESFKGGISSSLKRAGSAWGIGRYLYNLEASFVEIVQKGSKGARWGQTSEKQGKETFFWIAPKLPDWALPIGNKPKTELVASASRTVAITPKKTIVEQPSEATGDGRIDTQFKCDIGKFKGRTPDECLREEGVEEMEGYFEWIRNDAAKKGKPIDGKMKEFITRTEALIPEFKQILSSPFQQQEDIPFDFAAGPQ